MSPENPIAIQVLSSTKTDFLRALLRVFGAAFHDVETYCPRQPNDAYLQRLLSQDNVITVVALESGAVVGGLAAYELQKT